MRNFLPAAMIVALWACLAAAPVGAILPAAAPSPAETAEGQAIAATHEAGDDDRIAGRIRGIFAELPAFTNVSVNVSEGVVTLSGSVRQIEDVQRAEAIAGRVSGVAAVENTIERGVSVGEGLDALDSVTDRVAGFARMLPLIGIAALVALAIGALGYFIAGLGRIWRRVAPNGFLAEVIASAIRFVFVVGGLVVALDMIGAGALLGAVLGGAGVIGIALGFAMRDTIENYVASLMLSIRQPFRANDHVVIDSYEGRVIRLTSRATILMTLDGNHLRIPNSAVFKAVILNYTRNPQRRFEFVLGIDAEDDPDAARQLGVETLRGLDFVIDSPEPTAQVVEVGDSNIVLQFFGWIDQQQADFLKARSRAIPAVKSALENAGFALPEPIYRLRFDSGAPLPLEGVAGVAPAPARASETTPRKPQITVSPEFADTRPEGEIARMVEEERASTADAKDLLDPRRPVE